MLCSLSVCLSVCLLVTSTSCAITYEPIKMPSGTSTRVGSRNHVLGRVQDPPREGTFFVGGEEHFPTCCKLYGITGVRLIFATLLGRWPQRCGLSSPVLQQRVCILGLMVIVGAQPELLRGGGAAPRRPSYRDRLPGNALSLRPRRSLPCVCVCVCVWRKFVPNFARLPRLCVFKRRTTTVCCCGHSSANKKRIAINYARPAGVVRWPQHTRQPRNSDDVVLYAAE